MVDRIERELLLPAAPEDVWEVVTGSGWLADEVELELLPGGEASFRSDGETKTGWVEEAATRIRVVEARPLEVLDLTGIPLPGSGGAGCGPMMVATAA